MSLLPPTPPPEIPRLFIGGLHPSVSNAALSDLLSSFGAPKALSRATNGNYAHISLETDKPDQCIAALHNTVWRGASLQVQCAKEHFALRLRREWDEEANAPVDLADVQELAEQTGRDDCSISSKVPAGFKGVHTRFAFPDLDVSVGLADLSEEYVQLGGVDDVPDLPVRSVRRAIKAAGQASSIKKQPAERAPRRTGALSSTLELFGLSGTVPKQPLESVEQTESRPDGGSRPVKRRRVGVSVLDASYSKMVEREPGLVDVEKEKAAALSVLNGMFPSRSVEDVVRACQRLGLFRKLTPGDEIRKGGQRRQRVGKTVSARHQKVSRQPGTAPGLSDKANNLKSIDASSTPQEPPSHRRAGLYKKLRPSR